MNIGVNFVFRNPLGKERHEAMEADFKDLTDEEKKCLIVLLQNSLPPGLERKQKKAHFTLVRFEYVHIEVERLDLESTT